MNGETIFAKMISSSKETILYYYDADINPDDLNKENSGILEIDRCVFETMKPDDIENLAMFMLMQMDQNHIRIIQNCKVQTINRFGIDTLPFDIMREIFEKYLTQNKIPDFACHFSYEFMKVAVQNEIVRNMFLEDGVISKEDLDKLLAENGKEKLN